MGAFHDWKIILDQPAKAPKLGLDHYATAFSEIILSSEPRFAIGVFGGWGSGKTTLMNRIRDELTQARAQVIPVEFSAWRYEKEDHLIIPLLDAIRDAVGDWKAPRKKDESQRAKVVSTIGRVTRALVAGFSVKLGFPGAVDITYDGGKVVAAGDKAAEPAEALAGSTYYAAFKALRAAFAEFHEVSPGLRIVVFIDDLDRCLPRGALQVIESMKLFFDLDGFVFVVGLDKEVIAWSIDVTYREVLGKNAPDELASGQVKGVDYIKKIFQVPFDLRPVGVERVHEFFDAMLQEAALSPHQVGELEKFVKPHLRYLVSEGRGLNPRDVKRYINNFTMAMKTADPALGYEPHVILTLQTLATVPEWQYVYDALRGSREMFRLALADDIGGKIDSLRGYDPQFSALPNLLIEYLTAPNPGAALPNEAEIAKYLELGASSVDSSVDLIPDSLAMAIAQIREIRRSLQDVPLKGDQPETGAVAPLHQQLQGAAGQLESFLRSGTMDRIRGPLQQLEQMLSLTTAYPPDWRDRAEAWLVEVLSGISYYVNVERRRAQTS